MDNKLFWAMLSVLVLGIGAVVMLNNNDTTEPKVSQTEIAEIVAINEPNYRTKGPVDAPVELVEYGDFACGHCANAFPQVEQLLSRYEDQVQFQFRPFSIPAGQSSVIAHRAAEAAGMQGKFFEMYSLLYANQQIWSQSTEAKDIIDSYAQQIELDMDKYQADFSDSATLDIINDFKAQVNDIGVTGTPTFFINGNKIETQGSYLQTLTQAVEAELADSSSN